MKFKQKHDTVQDLLNTVQTGEGGGGSIDPSNYYTKTQCDDKFLTQSAATAYQPISGMSSYALKTEAVPEVTASDNNKVLKSAYSSSTGSYAWQTINEVPTVTSSDNGKILRANYFNATGTSTVTWENPPEELPVVGLNDSGKVLQAHVNATTSETSVAWADVATLPSYSNALDGDMLVVHETNGTRTLQWQNYIPATKNPADIGKVLTVSYTDASVDVPTLSWTTPSGGSGFTNVTLLDPNYGTLSDYIPDDGVYFVCLSCEGQNGSYAGIYIQHDITMCFTGFALDSNTQVSTDINIGGNGELSPIAISFNATLSFYPIQIFPPV